MQDGCRQKKISPVASLGCHQPFCLVTIAIFLRIPVGRKNLNAIVFSRSARLLLLEEEPGGADASVARGGDCSLFQAAGVLGGGEHLPATAAAGCWCYGAGSLGLEFATPPGASGCWRAAGSLTGKGPC